MDIRRPRSDPHTSDARGKTAAGDPVKVLASPREGMGAGEVTSGLGGGAHLAVRPRGLTAGVGANHPKVREEEGDSEVRHVGGAAARAVLPRATIH